MSNRIFPTIAPFIRAIFGQDDNDDFRVARVDYNGGLLAGPFGGFESRWAEYVCVKFPAGGNVYITTTAVPSGYLYVLQALDIWHSTGSSNDNRVLLSTGTTQVSILIAGTLAADTPAVFQGELILAPGDVVMYSTVGLPAGAYLNLRVWGYKVRLT